VDVSRENIRYLSDGAPPAEERERIEDAIRSHPQVHGLHDFVAYYSGHVIEVEFHAEVDGDLSLAEAHDIETELRERVREIEPVSDVHVHLDPAGLGEWKDAAERSSASTAPR
jgi:divalent metal cation (Fe/Co/Zn/Cd) transporter